MINDKETLNALSDAISEIGGWQWWFTEGDLFQMEFLGVLFYDESKAEKESHTSTLAIRFFGNTFAVFLDNLNDNSEKPWYQRFYDDEIDYFDVDPYELSFDDVECAKKIYEEYRNKTAIKDFADTDTFTKPKHILAGQCGDTAFVVGGDEIVVVGRSGEYTEEQIIPSIKRWWEYWRDYWRKRNTKEAYDKDWACEVTIPANTKDPKGQYFEE